MYRRVVLKLSGEALAGVDSQYDENTINALCDQIVELNESGLEIAIVVGGGNIMRGKTNQDSHLDRVSKDYMGMMATVINALAIQGYLEKHGLDTRVMTAIEMRAVAEPYILRRAIRHLEKKRVVIFGAGTGLPYFSTDTLAALRASEIKADVILMAKNGVDGVYSADPKLDPTAKKFDRLTYQEMIAKDLQVMDSTATSMCKDNDIDLVVFNIKEKNSIIKAANQKGFGTIIKKEFV